MKTPRHPLSLHPLAACLALVLGAPHAGAVPPQTASIVVQNCLDHGPGSLRQAVIDNTAGGPIDLTQLSCSSITLTTGAIEVHRAQLIKGPGPQFTISGARLDRVFTQIAAQPLALYGMTIQNGYVNSFGGGCVYSAGALQLKDTVVRDCRVFDIGSSTTVKGGGVLVKDTLVAINSAIVDNEAYSALGWVAGGGAYVGGPAVLDHSTISGNVVSNASGGLTFTGGIDILGPLTMMYSTVAGNRAQGLPNAPASIGGLRAHGASITCSTISGNSADGGVGGLFIYGSSTAPNDIVESTISGNSAGSIGGLAVRGNTSIRNSTIAFNAETGNIRGGGMRVAYADVDLESTIIAANTSAGGQTQNIGTGTAGSVGGANNLIGPSSSVSLPPDTIGGDPLLLPLHDNGGPTKTHALRPGSPAVDAGDDRGDTTDQRGPGFPRVVGPRADIGAFEGVDADSIFYDGFD